MIAGGYFCSAGRKEKEDFRYSTQLIKSRGEKKLNFLH
jgi:hypothetical protein